MKANILGLAKPHTWHTLFSAWGHCSSFPVIHIPLLWSLAVHKKDQLKEWKHTSVCRFPCTILRKQWWSCVWLTASLILVWRGQRATFLGKLSQVRHSYRWVHFDQRETVHSHTLNRACVLSISRTNYRELSEMDPSKRNVNSSRETSSGSNVALEKASTTHQDVTVVCCVSKRLKP